MKLWTYHSPVFSLVDGVYAPERSKYYSRYHDAYHKLWDCVGTRQLVWCCTADGDWSQKDGYCEWELDVPETSFEKIVDYMVWNGILGNNSGPSKRLRDRLYADAMRKAPDTSDEWVETEVQRMLHPAGDPWALLFLKDANDLRADILLKHPIQRSWVVSTKVH
jgi:hypothetical protein